MQFTLRSRKREKQAGSVRALVRADGRLSAFAVKLREGLEAAQPRGSQGTCQEGSLLHRKTGVRLPLLPTEGTNAAEGACGNAHRLGNAIFCSAAVRWLFLTLRRAFAKQGGNGQL